MKRSLGLLTGFLFVFGVLQAQRKPSKLFAELSFGPSFPLGQFAEKSYNGSVEEDQPGMASTGLAANVTVGYYLKENYGLLLTAGYSSNKQKEEGYREFMEKNNAIPMTEVYVDTDKWKIYKVMGGGFFVTPLVEDKLNLVTKLSAGIFKTSIPSYSWAVNGTTTGGLGYFSIGKVGKDKLPTAFCYQIGLGLQYKLNQHIHVLFDVNSFNATVKKDFTTYLGGAPVLGPGPAQPTRINRKYKFGSVNALLGIGVRF